MLNYLIDLFFPPVCAACHSNLNSNEEVFCTSCRHHLPLTQHHLLQENEAFKRFYGRVAVAFVASMLYFNKKGMVQELIYNLKYKGQQKIGTVLGNWYADDLKNIETLKSIDEIVIVPLHPKKLKKRGYNQITTFAQALSSNLKIGFNPNLLLRTQYSESQSKKAFVNRNEDINNKFDVHFSESDHNKHFLLLDDVLTTGATLEACSRALLKIPGTKISIICMAMTQ